MTGFRPKEQNLNKLTPAFLINVNSKLMLGARADKFSICYTAFVVTLSSIRNQFRHNPPASQTINVR